MTYKKAKLLAIDLTDDFSKLDIVQNYGKTYRASTKFERIGISAPVAASMPPRVNKVLKANYPAASNIGTLDMVGVGTIGDFINLFCAHAGESVPPGEPT